MANVKYTQVAAKAVSLAELFEARFEQGLPGPVPFRVELSAPDGPSTAGGKQAMQHIKLVPADGAAAIVMGSANTTTDVAEIRTFEHVAELFAQRYRGAKVPIDVTRYHELTQGLASFFKAMHFKVTFTEHEGASHRAPLATGGEERGRRTLVVVAGLGLALIVVAAAYAFIFLR